MRASIGFAARAAIGFALLADSAAEATYFIRPVIIYGEEFIDGYTPNGPTSGTQSFNDGFRSFSTNTNLSTGQIKTYGRMEGPDSVGAVVAGVIGERIRYFGPADAPATFSFNWDGFIDTDQFFFGDDELLGERVLGISANLAIYNAGDSDYLNWSVGGSNAVKALFVDRVEYYFDSTTSSLQEEVNDGIYTELNLVSGNYYDVYASFNLLMSAGPQIGPVEMDFRNTSTIGIQAPLGGSFTSSSGDFLGFAQTPGTGVVPEPASWAMLIAGFGLVGAAMRRRARADGLRTITT